MDWDTKQHRTYWRIDVESDHYARYGDTPG